MSDGYPHKPIILEIYLWLSNQLIQYHQEGKKHILGWNFGNISIEAFALRTNARNGFFNSQFATASRSLLPLFPNKLFPTVPLIVSSHSVLLDWEQC
jgi:hypothetical protein